MTVPATIKPTHALRLSSGAMELADGDPGTAVALAVHALAGVLAMTMEPEGLDALAADLGRDFGPDFGRTLGEAIPVMAALLHEVEAKMLARMTTVGRA